MTDKNTVALAREWADNHLAAREAGMTSLSPRTTAASEVIRALPDSWVDADKLRYVVADHHIDMTDELMEALGALLPSPPAPRPEDVPVGEPWRVEVDGETAVGFRNDPEDNWPWCVTYEVHCRSDWLGDRDVTLIARLVPETTERHEESEGFDPAYTYRDKDGDKWEYIAGAWIAGDTHEDRAAAREYYPGRDSLIDWFGPYTRIEEKEANE